MWLLVAWVSRLTWRPLREVALYNTLVSWCSWYLRAAHEPYGEKLDFCFLSSLISNYCHYQFGQIIYRMFCVFGTGSASSWNILHPGWTCCRAMVDFIIHTSERERSGSRPGLEMFKSPFYQRGIVEVPCSVNWSEGWHASVAALFFILLDFDGRWTHIWRITDLSGVCPIWHTVYWQCLRNAGTTSWLTVSRQLKTFKDSSTERYLKRTI
jgi:hypothetical protein